MEAVVGWAGTQGLWQEAKMCYVLALDQSWMGVCVSIPAFIHWAVSMLKGLGVWTGIRQLGFESQFCPLN